MNYGKNLSHAYIIAAQPEEGYAKARELASAMLCTGVGERPCGICRSCVKALKGVHPDILVVSRLPDDKGKPRREIYVDQIREISATAAILPNEADKKVYIIRDAGTMNASAQNALLKLLEEPPAFVSFILVADSAGLLLETVRSRCVTLSLNGEEDAPPPEARERAEKYLALAAGKAPLSLLSFANENAELSNSEALDFVRATRRMLADMLCFRLPDLGLSREKLMGLVRLMDRAEEYLRFNVSVKHLMGLLSVRTIESK